MPIDILGESRITPTEEKTPRRIDPLANLLHEHLSPPTIRTRRSRRPGRRSRRRYSSFTDY